VIIILCVSNCSDVGLLCAKSSHVDVQNIDDEMFDFGLRSGVAVLLILATSAAELLSQSFLQLQLARQKV